MAIDYVTQNELNVEYKVNAQLSAQQYIEILEKSGLGKRRPIKDVPRIEKLLANSNLVVTAWIDDQLIGVARAITDYAYCCYLSDLAVEIDTQAKGVGKGLIHFMHEHLGQGVSIYLLAAPNALSFYRHIGMKHVDNGYVMQREF